MAAQEDLVVLDRGGATTVNLHLYGLYTLYGKSPQINVYITQLKHI